MGFSWLAWSISNVDPQLRVVAVTSLDQSADFALAAVKDRNEPRGMTFIALMSLIALHEVRVAQIVARTQGTSGLSYVSH